LLTTRKCNNLLYPYAISDLLHGICRQS
jgi:hypothetical protein